jgi:hypothetical protein
MSSAYIGGSSNQDSQQHRADIKTELRRILLVMAFIRPHSAACCTAGSWSVNAALQDSANYYEDHYFQGYDID